MEGKAIPRTWNATNLRMITSWRCTRRFTGEISSARRVFSSDARQLVTKFAQFDLSPLFEEKKRVEKEEMRFAMTRPASSVISKL
ncbi:hypothetical protein RJ639_030868 [Escallonia herrerae]|uniref:NAF domain-containing protein n=1 Tax=Escallonia herrerae TaxID=1293975 RepID=A0AA88X2Y4_9ASTE|nr:hypothetical protein RJ639_030868 [Escallonia herrerae]